MTGTSTSRQSIEQLRAEIQFRAKLARQHVTGEVLLPDYFGKEEHDDILRQRIADTRRDMTLLAEKGIVLTPFLELGAERGQRSLVLANDFDTSGITTDISFHQLRAMAHFAELFELPKLPLRVCCDANHLPFRSGAFPFVFCYQFLHHFPALPPVLTEIRRVMRRGSHFWFGEEPFRRVLRLPLYRQRLATYAQGQRGRNRYVRLLESFISTERTDEVDHGIIENDEIDLSDWLAALTSFDRGVARLASAYGVRSRLARSIRPSNRLNWLLGGLLAGLARMDGEPSSDAAHANASNVEALLACPADHEPAAGGEPPLRPPLAPVADGYACGACGSVYPVRDGVVFLIPIDELRQLYPEVDG